MREINGELVDDSAVNIEDEAIVRADRNLILNKMTRDELEIVKALENKIPVRKLAMIKGIPYRTMYYRIKRMAEKYGSLNSLSSLNG